MATVNWTTYNVKKPNENFQGKVYNPATYTARQSPYKDQKYKGNYNYNVSGAQSAFLEQQNNKPAEYSSKYKDQLNQKIDSITNGKPFQYDAQSDALYKMYKNKAVNAGKTAMKNTVGQAAANTGGFGNSYAQTAGQAAYNESLSGLQDKALELASNAYSRYQDDRAEQYKQLETLQNLENNDYNRYRDTVSDYQTELSRLQDYYTQLQQMDRNAFDTDRAFNENAFQFDENLRYNSWNDKENRKQAQINAENSLNQNKWAQDWSNYYSGISQNQQNYQDAMQRLYYLTLLEDEGYNISGY